MRTSTTALVFIAIATIAGCRSGGADRTPAATAVETAERRGIGEPCRKNSDCISGAICSVLTCDFTNPCAVTETAADGTTLRSYVYDAAGREVSITTTHDGETIRLERALWSDDGREVTWKTWGSGDDKGPPDEVRTDYFDAHGDPTHSIEADGTEMGYVWSDSWACRAATMTSKTRGGDTLTSKATCDQGGGAVMVQYTNAAGVVTSLTQYVHEEGRVKARIARHGESYHVRFNLQRDARGAVTGVTTDRDNDGTVEHTEVYDLSCWTVAGDRVVYNAR